MVAYNVQSAVDTKHHLIVAHEVTNSGSDRSQLSTMAIQAKAALQTDKLDVVADRGYFKSEEILSYAIPLFCSIGADVRQSQVFLFFGEVNM